MGIYDRASREKVVLASASITLIVMCRFMSYLPSSPILNNTFLWTVNLNKCHVLDHHGLSLSSIKEVAGVFQSARAEYMVIGTFASHNLHLADIFHPE